MLNNGLIMITLEKSNLQVSLKQLNPYDIEAMEKAKKKNEVPVGAVVFDNNKIVSKAHNLVITKNNPIFNFTKP